MAARLQAESKHLCQVVEFVRVCIGSGRKALCLQPDASFLWHVEYVQTLLANLAAKSTRNQDGKPWPVHSFASFTVDADDSSLSVKLASDWMRSLVPVVMAAYNSWLQQLLPNNAELHGQWVASSLINSMWALAQGSARAGVVCSVFDLLRCMVPGKEGTTCLPFVPYSMSGDLT